MEDDEDDNGDEEEEDPKEDGGDDEDVTEEEEEEEDDNDVFKRKGMKMRKGMIIRMMMMLVWKRSLKIMLIRKRRMMKIFKRMRMVIARDCLATLPKGNVKAEIRDYIVCYEHCNCNRFLISCGRCSQLSSLLQCSFSEDVGVTNRRPS